MNRYLATAILSLALAACTGVLLRFGLLLGMPDWASSYGAVRHAHSHLMYFGWVGLGLMALIWRFLPRWTGRPLPKGVGIQMMASAVFALLSFPAFWANGYGVTQIGPVALPFGAMISGFNGMTWWVFAGLYVRATWGLPQRPLPIQLWDWAIALLLLAFGGALGFVGLVMMDSANISLQQVFLHLFLDLFAVGWLNLALLGVIWAYLGDDAAARPWLPTQSLALLLMPTFLLGVSPLSITAPIFWIAAGANLGAAGLLALHWRALWQIRARLPRLVRFGLLIFAAHIVSAFFIVWPGFWQWSAGTQLRIFFLHNFLLGWVSSGLLGIILVLLVQWTIGTARAITAVWMGGVSGMLLALLGVGFVHFLPVRATSLLWVAAWSSVGPALVALWAVVQLLRPGHFGVQTSVNRRHVEFNG